MKPARLPDMGKWVLGIIILGLLGGGGKYLDQFFGDLVPGSENAVHGITSGATSTLDKAASAVDQASRGCKSSKIVAIDINPLSYPEISRHIHSAISEGAPRILHLQLHGAQERYHEAAKSLDKKPGKTLDMYPIPASAEAADGIISAYVSDSEASKVSQILADSLSEYCSGQAFKIVFAG